MFGRRTPPSREPQRTARRARPWAEVVGGSALLATAVLLFGVYLHFRPFLLERPAGGPGPVARGLVLDLAVFAVLGAGLLAAAAWGARRRRERLLAALSRQTKVLRENPSRRLLQPEGWEDEVLREAAAPLAELELFGESYQNALKQVIRLQEKQETLRRPGEVSSSSASHASLRLADGGRPGASSPTSRYVVGSSRHRMVARLAPNFHWIAATPPLLEFFGRSTQELIARSFLDVVHPDDVGSLQQVLREALKDGEGHNITFRILLPDQTSPVSSPAPAGASKPPPRDDAPPSAEVPEEGVKPASTSSPEKSRSAASLQGPARHLQMDVMTCYNDKGIPLHLRCHILDITDRVRTEQELRKRSEELLQANARLRQINADLERLKESYRDLYHNAPVLYFSLDTWGQFVAFNETMLRTLGYTREMLLGKPYITLLPEDSRETFLKAPSTFQQPGEVETQWIKADGAVIDVWIDTTTIRDTDGGFIRSRSAARDVTERNRLARALQLKAAELVRANAQLRRTNQELEDFTYIVSHDLKEPLRTLEAFSNFLAMDYGQVLQGEGQVYLDHLIQASRRLGMLIDDLLTLSRAGQVIKEGQPFSWDDVVGIVLGDLQSLVNEKKAAVRIEGPLPAAVGDRERIIQLLSNLVSNGLKYNRSPRPEIIIGAIASDGAGHRPHPPGEEEQRYISLFVKDNGIGIEPRYHEQIFRMFRRLHLREEIPGTGAGLAICKKIVEAHGGRIWVESEQDQGATFYFTLPCLAGPSAPSKPAPEQAGTLPPGQPDVPARVDDRTSSRKGVLAIRTDGSSDTRLPGKGARAPEPLKHQPRPLAQP